MGHHCPKPNDNLSLEHDPGQGNDGKGARKVRRHSKLESHRNNIIWLDRAIALVGDYQDRQRYDWAAVTLSGRKITCRVCRRKWHLQKDCKTWRTKYSALSATLPRPVNRSGPRTTIRNLGRTTSLHQTTNQAQGQAPEKGKKGYNSNSLQG